MLLMCRQQSGGGWTSNNNNKHIMVVFYDVRKKYNGIQLSKNKLDLEDV